MNELLNTIGIGALARYSRPGQATSVAHANCGGRKTSKQQTSKRQSMMHLRHELCHLVVGDVVVHMMSSRAILFCYHDLHCACNHEALRILYMEEAIRQVGFKQFP